jgi:hypothetical protein
LRPTPYSHAVGVANTRTSFEPDGTLEELAKTKPVALAVEVDDYHSATKKERGNIKKALPYFVGGEIQGKRHDDNVVQRTLLTLDVEATGDQDPPPSPQDVVEALKELGAEGWVYTSLSHTKAEPRYRVVLPLAKPLSDGTALQASTQSAAAKLGIKEWTTPESWVLSQAMYLPAKLQGAPFYSKYVPGDKRWPTVRKADTTGSKQPADIPDERPDFVLQAIKQAGLYLKQNPKHPGMHFITCPFVDEHEAENETQTVYYEAHFDGNPRAAVKCFDTSPDVDGRPHLTYSKLCKWLVMGGFLDQRADTGALEEYADFLERANLGSLLDSAPAERQFAIDKFCPVGKVTVLSGPGGVSKSMLLLHTAIHGAVGLPFGPFNVSVPLKTLVVSYEDDQLELHKRMTSLTEALRDDGLTDMLYDIEGSMRRNLLMFPADEEAGKWLLMTKPERFGPAEASERVQWLAGFCKQQSIKLLILDPAVYTHTLEESDNGEMAQYMQMLNHLAKQAECAIVLVHHMHKTALWATVDEINQGSLRGAGALADNARSVGVMISMPIKDAVNYGLPADHETTSRYAVFKHVKHNYSASLGVMVFERKGPLLVPRPDIQKLDAGEVREAMQQAKDEAAASKLVGSALRLLKWLASYKNDGASKAMAAQGACVHPREMKAVCQYCEENDLLTLEPGAHRSDMLVLTDEAKPWIKAQEKEQKGGRK